MKLDILVSVNKIFTIQYMAMPWTNGAGQKRSLRRTWRPPMLRW